MKELSYCTHASKNHQNPVGNRAKGLYCIRQNQTMQSCKSIPKRPIAKTAPKILISKKIVQNGPLHCPKRPIIQTKRPTAKSKTAHSYIQNGPLSLSAFGNVQSDLEILYVEASYTWVRGLDDSETVKCSAMHYGVTCSKFKSVNGRKYCM